MTTNKLLERAAIGADVLEAYDATERALRDARDPETADHLKRALDALMDVRYILDAPA